MKETGPQLGCRRYK